MQLYETEKRRGGVWTVIIPEGRLIQNIPTRELLIEVRGGVRFHTKFVKK